MKRYFITLMAVLFLCLGFRSVQTEAKTYDVRGDYGVINNVSSGLIDLGTTTFTHVRSLYNRNYHFKVPKTGYYTVSCETNKDSSIYVSIYEQLDLGDHPIRTIFSGEKISFYWYKGYYEMLKLGLYEDKPETSCKVTITYHKNKPSGKVIKEKVYKVANNEKVLYDSDASIGSNILLDDVDCYFKAPTAAKYRVTAKSLLPLDHTTQLRVFGGGSLGWDIVQGDADMRKWEKERGEYGPFTCELEKGQKLEFSPLGIFKVRITKIAENKGKETVETGERISLKTGDKGKTVWKVSNGNAKVVKTSSKSAQIEGVKKGKAKVTAKVNGCTYTWTVTVKKSEKQINEELHANISTKCYPFKYNPGSMLLWIENDGDSVSLTGTIGLYKDGVEVETIPFSRALIGGQYITVVKSGAGVDFDEVKFKEFTVKKSSKNFNDVEPDYGKMTYNKTDGYAIYTVPAVSGANSTFEGYALWISDSGEMLFYDALSVTGTEIKIPIEVVDQLEEEDPTYYCFCYE